MNSGWDERGQGLVEYALILVLVALVVIGVLALLGPQVQDALAQILYGLYAGQAIEEGDTSRWDPNPSLPGFCMQLPIWDTPRFLGPPENAASHPC